MQVVVSRISAHVRLQHQLVHVPKTIQSRRVELKKALGAVGLALVESGMCFAYIHGHTIADLDEIVGMTL